MTDRTYKLFLDNKIIGVTEFEFADVPMNVVFGKIHFFDSNFSYEYLKNYCIANYISILNDYPDDKLISTDNIPNLQIMDDEENLISADAKTIEGTDNDFYTIHLLGVSTVQYEKYFSKHITEYQNKIFE